MTELGVGMNVWLEAQSVGERVNDQVPIVFTVKFLDFWRTLHS
jgi:hypothetical protein